MKIDFPLYLGIARLFRPTQGSLINRQLLSAVFGIAFSIVPLFLVMVVTNGMIEGILQRYLETSTYHLQAVNLSFSSDMDNQSEIKNTILEMDEIEQAWRELQGYGLASSGERKEGITIRCLEKEIYQQDPGFRQFLRFTDGSFNLEKPKSLLLGAEIAKKLGVKSGDRIAILSGRKRGQSLSIKPSFFRITGIFTTGYQDLDRIWAIISFKDGKKVLHPDSSRSFIGIKVIKPFRDLLPLVERIEEKLGGFWKVDTWKELAYAQYQNFLTTKSILYVIMFLLICVAAFNIFSTLVTLVLDKREEIAVLKTMGTSPRTISFSFLITGVMTGFSGLLIGIPLGFLFSVNINYLINVLEFLVNNLRSFISFLFNSPQLSGQKAFQLLDDAYYLSDIPVVFNFQEILLVMIFTLLLSAVASWVPARKAGIIRPLQVLRKR